MINQNDWLYSAAWGEDWLGRRSVSEYVPNFFKHTIAWTTRRQLSPTFTEAGLTFLALAVYEGLRLKKLLKDFDFFVKYVISF